jgi:NtrC-family two-component system response regulator AlgB
MTTPLNVLVVDDDQNISRTLAISLKEAGCAVAVAPNVQTALTKLKASLFDLVLTDYRMEGGTGLDLVQQAHQIQPQALLVMMTAFASYENAVAAVKEGAFDYLPKPFTSSQLEHLLSRVRLVVDLRRENEALRQTHSRPAFFAGMASAASTRLEEFVGKVAPSQATILLVGESGTGKSELARLIHSLSSRADQPLILVDCAVLAESLLESELFGHVKGAFTGAAADKPGKLLAAAGGTLFLDEVGELSAQGQAKLLRFLQDKVFEPVGSNQPVSVDTRIIAASNRDLRAAVAQGKFRQDLYYRLNVFECRVPPLRERSEDLPVLIYRFLNEGQTGEGGPAVLPKPVLEALLAYDWPGNVRELRNVMQRLLILGSGTSRRELRLADLPDAVLIGKPQSEAALKSLAQVEREQIEKVLASEKNLERAAEALGITSVTLWRKRKEYGLA